MSTLKRYTAGTVPMIFAAVVIAAGFIVAACSDTQSPVAPGAGIGGEARSWRQTRAIAKSSGD